MRRLLHLDGLRGWAALFVILHHLELGFFPAIKGSNDGVSPILGPFSFLVDGPLAVAIFFLLSGIVLAEAVEAARRRYGAQKIGLTSLVVKRWLRLGLPIIVTGLLILILFISIGNRTTEASAVAGSDWMHTLFPPGYHPHFLDVLRETTIGAFVGPQTPVHDPVLWTIRVEFMGSILVFLLCLFIPSGFARLAACAISGMLLIAVPAWLPNFCALFAVGVALHDLAAHMQHRIDRHQLVCDVLGLAAILTATMLYPVLNLLVPDLMDRLGSLADPLGHMSQWTARSILIVAGTLISPTAQSFLSLPISLFLGRVSFGLYLLHLPVLFSLGIASYLAIEPVQGATLAAGVASLLVLSTSLAGALVFHHLIERPSIRLAGKAGALASPRTGETLAGG
ncbi:MAG TPA: acyltransferase [Dongiaceae bacterium]|nr:acyltransferase [Dongiaceae bacterium]